MTLLPAPPLDLLAGASLFLDFDGTLVELEDQPDDVRADDDLIRLMKRLGERLDGRLAIVTGRASERIVELFGDVAFAIGGSHGVEFRWPDGRLASPTPPESLSEVIAALRGFVGDREGIIVETKPYGAGLHYRLLPEVEAEANEFAADLATAHGLQLQPGKMMVELRAAAGHKGSAIELLMREGPFVGSRPLFLGDDVTDEDGFRVVSKLGGEGVLVGPQRETAATHRLEGVTQVREWLARSMETL